MLLIYKLKLRAERVRKEVIPRESRCRCHVSEEFFLVRKLGVPGGGCAGIVVGNGLRPGLRGLMVIMIVVLSRVGSGFGFILECRNYKV